MSQLQSSITSSSPQRITSGQAYSPSSPSSQTSYRPQSKLKELISNEFNNQTYEFEANLVARMLSPKLPRKDVKPSPHSSLEQFDCLIDDPAVQMAMQKFRKLDPLRLSKKEETSYPAISDFLNDCVENCDKVYDAVHQTLAEDSPFKVAKRADRWFPSHFLFTVYDKPTGDGVQNASPLKPDIVGFDGAKVDGISKEQLRNEIVCWWSVPPPETENANETKKRGKPMKQIQILISTEVKAKWPELVAQSATYARCQFADSPLRSFTVVIAVNHVQHQLRYLIFHHGGVSASRALSLNSADDSVAIQKILLSILLWQSAADAGIPLFTDGNEFHLPSTFNRVLTIERIIYHSLSIRGRNTFVARMETVPNSKGHSQQPVTPGLDSTDQLSSHFFQTVHVKTTAQASAPSLDDTRKQELGVSTSRPKTDSSGVQETEKATTRTDSRKRSADEAAFKPIIPREKKRRKLTAAEPSSPVIKDITPLPPTMVIKCSWPNAVRESMEPDMYNDCGGEFGVPKIITSFAACFREGRRMCNSIFLPPEGEEPGKYYWNVFSRPTPEKADRRSLWITVLANEGRDLTECLDASDLCQCLLHSMLGWLSLYQHGYLHRDVSIGNLLKLVEPASCKPFNIWGITNLLDDLLTFEQRENISKLETLDQKRAFHLAVDKPEHKQVLIIAKELEATLTQLELTTQCKAIITDGDMAAYIPKYFDDTSVHDKKISGTIEFMSSTLLDALKSGKPILQSPMDDLWSFFWTALWAILFNIHNTQPTNEEKLLRDDLRAGHSFRDGVANVILRDPTMELQAEYSLIFRQMMPVLRDWYKSLIEMTFNSNKDLFHVERDDHGNHVETKAKHVNYLIQFHKVAYTGLLEFVRIVSKSNLLKQPQIS